jgi:hypothetical protein
MLLHHAITLNNRAASFASRESVTLFRMALKSLRQHCRDEPMELEVEDAAARHRLATSIAQGLSSEANQPSWGNAISFTPCWEGMEEGPATNPFPFHQQVNRSSVMSTGTSLMGHGRQNDNYLSVFDRTFMISIEGHVTNNLVAAVVLFNLAIHHHAMGMIFGRSIMLARAKTVYQMSLAALQSFNDGDGEIPDLLLLAILNNLAELETSFHPYGATRSYLDCVRAMLGDEDLDLSDEDLQLFFLNALLPEPAGAAAA